MTFLKSLSGTDWSIIIVVVLVLAGLFARKRRGTGWHVIALATIIIGLFFAVVFGHYHLFSHPVHLP